MTMPTTSSAVFWLLVRSLLDEARMREEPGDHVEDPGDDDEDAEERHAAWSFHW